MSQKYKLRLNDMLNSDTTQPREESEASDREAAYHYASNVSNVNFILLNGDMLFLNYGYLVSGKYDAADNYILLSFTSHDVKLGGIYLLPLYFDFMRHLPQNVMCMDARYNITAEKDKPVINAIDIEKK